MQTNYKKKKKSTYTNNSCPIHDNTRGKKKKKEMHKFNFQAPNVTNRSTFNKNGINESNKNKNKNQNEQRIQTKNQNSNQNPN